MAFSKTLQHRGVAGGLAFEIYSVDFASVTSGSFSTGLSDVLFAAFNNYTTEGQGLTKRNYDGSTTVKGSVAISSVTSSDVGEVIVFGRV